MDTMESKLGEAKSVWVTKVNECCKADLTGYGSGYRLALDDNGAPGEFPMYGIKRGKTMHADS